MRLQYNRVIPGVSLSWGMVWKIDCPIWFQANELQVCLGNGFIHNFAGLAVCRLLLGLFEGLLFPSMVFMMANWYRREELGYRVGWVYSEFNYFARMNRLGKSTEYSLVCIAVQSAFGGLFAFAILHMNGVAWYPGWRW